MEESVVKRKQQGTKFDGDLPAIRKAIDTVAKSIVAGQKKAAAQVAKGERAPMGSPERANLAANRATLRKANKMVVELRKAKTMMGNICCQNDQGCNLFVL